MKFELESLADKTLKSYIFYCSLGGMFTYILPFSRFIFPLVFILFFLKFLISSEVDKKFLFSIFIILYIFYSLLFNDLQYILYGLYVFYAILFSFVFKGNYYLKIFKDFNFWFIIFLINCFGILYVNYDRPIWIGLEQELLGLTKQVSREWGTLGMFRNPGFTNNSVTVASLIAISGIITLENIYSKKNIILIPLCIMIYYFGVYCLYLSTTKTVMYSFIFLSILRFFPILIIKLITILILLISIVFSMYYFFFGGVIYSDTDNSLLIRMEYTWPWSYSNLNGYQSIFGGGFGKVGSPSYLIGNGIPADNFLIYLYMIFGIFTLIFGFNFLSKFFGNIFKLKFDKLFLLIFLALIIFSFTNNLVESIVFPVVFGILVKKFYCISDN